MGRKGECWPRRVPRGVVVAAVLAVALAGLGAACTEQVVRVGEPQAADRGAQAQDVPADWDFSMTLDVRNFQPATQEIGFFADPGSGGDVQLAPTPPAQPAGTAWSTVTVPAGGPGASDSGLASLLYKAKTSSPRRVDGVNGTDPPAAPPEQVATFALPGLRLRVALQHQYVLVSDPCWQSPSYPYTKNCSFERRDTLVVSTYDGLGRLRSADDIAQCAMPVRFEGEPTFAKQATTTLSPSDVGTLTVDLEAVATVNGRSCGGATREYHDLILSGLSLAPQDAQVGLQLAGAKLYDAQLAGTDLRGANLSGIVFASSRQGGTNLAYADLRGADLSLANLAQADLTGARLDGAKVDGMKLDDAVVFGVDFSTASGAPDPDGLVNLLTCETIPPGGTDPVSADCGASISTVVDALRPAPGAAPAAVLNNTPLVLPLVGGTASSTCAPAPRLGPHQQMPVLSGGCDAVYGTSLSGTNGEAYVQGADGGGGDGWVWGVRGPGDGSGFDALVCLIRTIDRCRTTLDLPG